MSYHPMHSVKQFRKSHTINIFSLTAILVLTVLIVGLLIYFGFPFFVQDQTSITVVIAGTNDIHGTYFPSILIRKDTMQKYKYGGLEVLAKLIQIVRNQNPQHFLYLDAGDQFQGGFESSPQISSGQIMVDYFDHMNVGASAPGNHQFDFGPQFLQKYLQKVNDELLSANFIDSKFKQSDSGYLPLSHQHVSRMFSFPISPNLKTNLTQIKIGVIGLATLQTYYTTNGFLQHMFPESYKILNYTEPVIKESEKLKMKGANAVIILSHIGNSCSRQTSFGIWTQKNMGNIEVCDKNDQIFKLVDSLPEGTVDAIFQGHRHTTSHFFYKGIPILGNINGGYTFSLLHLPFRISQKDLIQVDKQRIKIEGPIPVCEKIFQNTGKCEFIKEQDLPNAGNLVHWNFHGQKVQRDEDLKQLSNSKWQKIMQPFEVEIIQNFIPFQLQKLTAVAYNPLGNLITNFMSSGLHRMNIGFDFIVINSRGFRATWYPGIIRLAQINSMFPFPSKINLFQITGQNLKKMIQMIQTGDKRYYPTWGLSQTLQTTIDGRLSLINLVFADGSPVIDTNIYTGASLDFLTEGGDDFKNVIRYFIKVQNTDISLKTLVKQQLQMMDHLTEQNLKNPSNLQRLIVLQDQNKNSKNENLKKNQYSISD